LQVAKNYVRADECSNNTFDVELNKSIDIMIKIVDKRDEPRPCDVVYYTIVNEYYNTERKDSSCRRIPELISQVKRYM